MKVNTHMWRSTYRKIEIPRWTFWRQRTTRTITCLFSFTQRGLHFCERGNGAGKVGILAYPLEREAQWQAEGVLELEPSPDPQRDIQNFQISGSEDAVPTKPMVNCRSTTHLSSPGNAWIRASRWRWKYRTQGPHYTLHCFSSTRSCHLSLLVPSHPH